MDYNSNAIEIIPEPSGVAPWFSSPALDDPSMWATDDDYASLDADLSAGGRDPRGRAGIEQPSSAKKPRGDPSAAASKSKAIGKMFFKTKLCCKFRAGTCPYITNCNFAHGIEELRKPPPNWQEIVTAADDGGGSEHPPPREEHQIPILTSSGGGGDSQRSYKGRHCKKFYTEEGCPYGDSCTFLHDEQSRLRESVAISLGPTAGSGGNGAGAGPGGYSVGANGLIQKPSNWKTRICNKWEITGYCPFGNKCHFAHGATELNKYGGGISEGEGRDASYVAPDTKNLGTTAKTPSESAFASNVPTPHGDTYHMGASMQRAIGGVGPRQGQRPLQKWKGPDNISRIYGDWIFETE